MTTLNRNASLAMREAGANAATDITGYGLVGHLVEMAEASKVGIELWASKIPIHAGALQIVEDGTFEPGIMMNLNSFGGKVDRKEIDDNMGSIIFGSETSGGLAVVLPENNVENFLKKYHKPAAVIGHITAENPGRVSIKR